MKKVEKATEIKNAKIQFVSLVDAAANKRRFLLKKEEGGKVTFSAFGRIVKTDRENHYVTGIVYSPLAEDSHGDFMTEEEITKAAYFFAKNGSKVDIQHSFEPFDGATVVENWVAKADFKIGSEDVCKGSWLLTVEVTDKDVWDKIEKGEISGFSMGGIGEYSEEDIDLDAVEKAGKKISSKNKETLLNIYESLGAFVKEFDDPEPEEDGGEGEPDKGKEDKEVTKQDIEKIVASAIEKAMGGSAQQNAGQQESPQDAQSGAGATEKAVGNGHAAPAGITPEAVERMVGEAIAKALTPQEEHVTAEQVQEMITAAVAKAVDPILKSRGLPSNLGGTVEKSAGEAHYLHGIL